MTCLSVRNAGRAVVTQFICKRPYGRAVESDGSVGFVRKSTGIRPLPRDEAGLITLKEERFPSRRLFRRSQDHQTISDAIIDNKAHIGICSLSEVHDHELMWAHYRWHSRLLRTPFVLSAPRLYSSAKREND
jgi:hypothetical protein